MKTKIWASVLFFSLIFAVSAHADYARIIRVTMNDGSTQYYWVDQVSEIKILTEKSTLSSSSVTVASSSSATAASSSSATVASSSSAKAASSSSATVASSSSAKAASSSSATVASSSSAKAASSSSATVASSSSAKAASSSSATVASSSSEQSTRIVSIKKFNSQMSWNARQQTLLLSAAKTAQVQVSVFDIQGIRVSQLNVFVLRGYNSVSLSSLHLANGKYVLHVEMDGVRLQKVVSIGNVGK